eukprot:comp17294_c0_seq1/m.28976 comp17294_c0_seq1/g.28976  ORF comp17294_c0_seq1/g.28976 comp17294_c0_seq1/m.28976 type:complete len:168 (-) comp17294_c0_seq1:30-533(-)
MRQDTLHFPAKKKRVISKLQFSHIEHEEHHIEADDGSPGSSRSSTPIPKSDLNSSLSPRATSQWNPAILGRNISVIELEKHEADYMKLDENAWKGLVRENGWKINAVENEERTFVGYIKMVLPLPPVPFVDKRRKIREKMQRRSPLLGENNNVVHTNKIKQLFDDLT